MSLKAFPIQPEASSIEPVLLLISRLPLFCLSLCFSSLEPPLSSLELLPHFWFAGPKVHATDFFFSFLKSVCFILIIHFVYIFYLFLKMIEFGY